VSETNYYLIMGAALAVLTGGLVPVTEHVFAQALSPNRGQRCCPARTPVSQWFTAPTRL
jgi:hypothetical protein